MFNYLNLDKAAESVKHIVDRIRCIICDKTNGSRARYPCGHSACTECVDYAPYCLLCLTPSLVNEDNRPTLDDALTTRVKHANQLLQAFQEIFQVDVARRQRISEHLKKEKELFPKCIQAVHTYNNKRKSKTTFNKTREDKHRCVLPGEEVESPSSVKMDTSKNYVLDWLDKNDLMEFKPRKPFSDLEVNRPQFQSTPLKNRTDRIFDNLKKKEPCSEKRNRKRCHSKIALHVDKNQSLFDLSRETKLKGETSGWKSVKTLTKQKKCGKEESRIFKDDEIFTVEDSQDYKNKQNVENGVVKDDKVDKHKSRLSPFLKTKVKGNVSVWKSVKRQKEVFDNCDNETPKKQNKCEKEESGIVKDYETSTIEDSQDYKIYKKKQKVQSGVVKGNESIRDDEATKYDEVIVIEGSQDHEIDKDRQAYLAVLQAHENETHETTELNVESILQCKEFINYTNDIEVTADECLKNVDIESENIVNLVNSNKVQFFKKSTLHDLCRACDIEEKQRIRSKNFNNISIRLETDKLITKITVSRLLPSQQACLKKHSKLIQTDGDVSRINAKTDVTKNTFTEHVVNDNLSQDLFTGEPEANPSFDPVAKENETTVVSETSSDSEIEQSCSLVIRADVHQSKDDEDRNILGELLSGNRIQRSVARGCSPESSNSSDKENRDPNMMKKRRHLKDSKKKPSVVKKKSSRF